MIPIGCSCINQFQAAAYADRYLSDAEAKSGVLDWNIVTPDSTVELLTHCASGEVKTILRDRRNYVAEDVAGSVKLRNAAFSCMYFWHEDATRVLHGPESSFEEFANKVSRQIDNFLLPGRMSRVVLLWSNIQPNLQLATSSLAVKWEAFRLTMRNYECICEAAYACFGQRAEVVAAGRMSDVDEVLWKQPNVFVMELDRSSNFRGPAEFYTPMLARYLGERRQNSGIPTTLKRAPNATIPAISGTPR
jgi:hypothetical protein